MFRKVLLSFLAVGMVSVGSGLDIRAAVPPPKPIGPDGRAIYRMVLLNPVPSATEFRELVGLGFDVERDGQGRVIAYLSPEEMGKLEGRGWRFAELMDPGLAARERDRLAATTAAYHDYTALTTALQQVAADHPSITRLVSAGTSVQGRQLWWLRITDNPDASEDEPAFKYIATMHGDEPVGTENLLQLIDWLTDRYATDTRVARLVNNVEIWIMPLMNPDGNALNQRYNADGYDLNRSFPDPYEDPLNDPTGHPIEVQRMMNWQAGHTTVMSANFHGGALVVNYPFDNNETGSSVYTACPDDDIVIEMALEYSEDNSPMYNSPSFDQGITNGAAWYAISGGMQDWNYVYHGDIEFCIEISNTKWPAASQLAQFWEDNRESMLSYMERVLTGVRGVVTDAQTGLPVPAQLSVVGRDALFFADPALGDFHRPMPAGTFQLLVEAPGYEPKTVPFTITDSEADAVRVDVALNPRPAFLEFSSYRVALDSNSNGWLEGGETGRLAVTLRNVGAALAGINGTLRPLTPHAQITSAALWPDLGVAQQAESNPPHFGVDVSSSTPPGHQLGFAVEWASSGGNRGTTGAFFVPVGPPQQNNKASTDVPKTIGDNSTVNSLLPVTLDGEIAEVNVMVNLTHTYIGDLRLILIAPDGTQIRLHDRSGGSTDNIVTTYDTLTAPVDSLALLKGKPSQGTWTLRVEDKAGGDTGTLNSWSLELFTRPWENPVAEVLLSGLTREADGKTSLNWWPVGTALSYKVYRTHDPRAEAHFSDCTGEDMVTSDTSFVDASLAVPGQATFWLVTAVGHSGEGLWGHFGH